MKLILLALSFFLLTVPLYSQESDSLSAFLESIEDPQKKADTLCSIGWDLVFKDLGKAYDLFIEAERISKEENYPFGIGNAQNRLGTVYYLVGEADTALIYYRSALSQFQIAGNIEKTGSIYLNMGNVFSYLEDYDSTYHYALKSLEVFKQSGDSKSLAMSYGNLGNYFQVMGAFEKALDYYYKTLEIQDSLGDLRGLANTYNNIALVSWELENYESARSYLARAVEIWKSQENLYSLAKGYLNIGGIFQDTDVYDSAISYTKRALNLSLTSGDVASSSKAYANLGAQFEGLEKYDSALLFSQKALMLYRDKGNKPAELRVVINMTSLFQSLKQYNEGLNYANRGITLAKDLEDYGRLAKLYRNKSTLLETLGKTQESLHFAKLYIDGVDSIQNSQIREALREAQVRYETEEKDLQIKNLNQENQLKTALVEKKELELQKSRLLRNLLSIVALLLIIAAGSLYRSFRIKKRVNLQISEKNEELNAQNEEIMAQRDQLESQNRVIGEKNKEITDSIYYGERIQKALLPSEKVLKALFQSHFLIYIPKNIVSGDFYWAQETETHKFLAVADCTGHGVPGAFMSMIGMEQLNQIVLKEGVSDPGTILNKLHDGISKGLEQDQSAVNDGMDMALISQNKKTGEIHFSGAKNHLIQSKNESLVVFKGDKIPIGGHAEEGIRKFTSQLIETQKGDRLFLFSDGIQDQFGGPKGKKLMIKRMKEWILETNHQGVPKQGIELESMLLKWKGVNPQTDDICMIGIGL